MQKCLHFLFERLFLTRYAHRVMAINDYGFLLSNPIHPHIYSYYSDCQLKCKYILSIIFTIWYTQFSCILLQNFIKNILIWFIFNFFIKNNLHYIKKSLSYISLFWEYFFGIGESSNGRTPDFDSVCLGSNPSSPTSIPYI